MAEDDQATRQSVWIPVREHLEILRASDREHARELRAADDRGMTEIVRRIDSTHATFEKVAERLQVASNEWRAALNDRDRVSVTRIEFTTRVDALEEKSEQASATNAALLASLATEVRTGFARVTAETAAALETLRLTNAERVGGHNSLIDLRVWILAAAAFVSTVMAVVGFMLR